MFDYEDFMSKKGQRRVLFLTGAGLSAESGISTFRDSTNALWENYSIDQVCNISTFDINYEIVHKFYSTRRVQLGTVYPNAAHIMIAELQKLYGPKVMHITANVDDLAERAGGCAMHVHGVLTEVVEDWIGDNWSVVECGYNEYIPRMGCIAKPNVVLFGECFRYHEGKKKPIYDEMYACIDNLTENDIVVVIGSSDTVIPWSYILSGKKCTTININPKKNKQSAGFDFDIILPVTEAVDSLTKQLKLHLNQKD